MEDKRDVLYKNLLGSGRVSENEIGTLDQFKSAIKDEGSARQFHKNLLGAGFTSDEIGSDDDFYNSISSDFDPKHKDVLFHSMNPNWEQGVVPAVPSYKTGNKPATTSVSSETADPVHQEVFGQSINPEWNQHFISPYTGKKETEDFSDKPTFQTYDNVRDYYAGKFSMTEEGKAAQGEIAEIEKDLVDTMIGRMKQSDEYKEIVASDAAPGDKDKTLQAIWERDYQPEVDKFMQPFINEYGEKIINRYGQSMQGDYHQLDKDNASASWEGINNRIERAEAELDKTNGGWKNVGRPTFESVVAKNEREAASKVRNEKVRQISAARSMMERSQKMIQAANDEKDGTFLGGLGRGFRDETFNLDNWTFGVKGMRDGKACIDVMEKYERGEKLTKEEEILMDALASEAATQAYFSSELGKGYKYGSVTGASLPFMVDMMTGMGLVSGATKAASKGLMKWIAKKGLQAVAKGIKDSAIHTASFGAARVGENYLDRAKGNAKFDIDNEGNVHYAGRKGMETGAGALGKAFASTALETQSELIGAQFGPALNFVGKQMMRIPGIRNIPASKIGKLAKEYSGSAAGKMLKDFTSKTQFHGALGEYAEEVYNNIGSTLLGDMTPEQLVSLDQNLDTFLSVSVMSAAFGTVGTAAFIREKYKTRKNMRDFEKVMRDNMDYDAIKESLKDADIEGAKTFIKEVMADKSLSPKERKEEIEYIVDVLKESVMGSAEQEIGKEPLSEEEIEANKAAIVTEFEQARKNLESAVPPEILSMVDAGQDISSMSMSEEQEMAVADYTAAKSGMDDYMNSVDNKVAEAKMEARREVEGVSNPDMGAVVRVTRRGSDVPINIVGGKITFDEEGLIDKENSDDIIYYIDENGKRKQGTPGDFEKLVDSTDTESVAQQAEADAEQQVLDEEQAQLPQPYMPQPGEEVVLPNGYLGTVAGMLDSETVIVSNGESTVAAKLGEVQPANSDASPTNSDTNPTNPDTNPTKSDTNSVNESPVSSIQQPQPVEEKAEQVTDASRETEQPAEEPKSTAMPMIGEGEDMEPDFKSVDPQRTYDYLYGEEGGLTPEEASAFVDANIAEKQKAVEKFSSKAPKMGTSLVKYRKAQAEWKAQAEAAQKELDYWNSVKSKRDEVKAAEAEEARKVKAGEEVASVVREMGEPLNGEELAATMLANGAINLRRDEFTKETGYGNAEASKLFGLFRTKDNGGVSLQEAGELVMQADREAGTNFFDQNDPNAGRNAILDVLASSTTPSDLRNFIKNNREAQAKKEEQAERDYFDSVIQSSFHMSLEEFELYNEVHSGNPYEGVDLTELDAIFAEPINYNDYGQTTEQRGIAEQAEGSEGILPPSQPGNPGNPSEINQEWNAGKGSAVAGDHDGNVQETTSGGELDTDGRRLARRKKIQESLGTRYLLSEEQAKNGEVFYQNQDGSTILAEIPDEIFDKIGLEPVPFKLTETMGYHVYDHHKKEAKFQNIDDAIEFVLSVINNVDHVRLGRDNSYIFSVEDGRNKLGRRAITIMVNSQTGQFMGIRTSGYETIDNLKKRPLLWMRGTLAASEDVATPTITTIESQQGDETSSRTKSQSNESLLNAETPGTATGSSIDVSISKDSNNDSKKQEPKAITTNIQGGILDIATAIAKEQDRQDVRDQVNTEPSEAQKEAGNYKKGHLKVDGFDVSIENPKGSTRRGKDVNGTEWSVTMNNDYGYIRRTEGADGDHVDVFLSDNPEQGDVFVVDQVKADGSFDEHKVMYGFNSEEEARAAYLANYSPGWKGLGAITRASKEEFKEWVKDGAKKSVPFADTNVKPQGNAESVTIKPAQYTTKKGKVLDMQLVTPASQLDKEQVKQGTKFAKDRKGWYDFAKGGFMMRSEEDAKAMAAFIEEMNTPEKMENIETPENQTYDELEETETLEETEPEVQASQLSTWKANATPINTDGSYDIILNGEQEHITITKDFGNGVFVADAVNSQGERHQFIGITEEQIRKGIALMMDKDASSEKSPKDEPGKPVEKKRWKYSLHVDKTSGYTTIERDDVYGVIPITDGNWKIKAESPEEMLEILSNPKNNTQELLDEFGVTLKNKISFRKIAEEEKKAKEAKPAESSYGSNNKMVTNEQYEALKARMKKKLNQLNMGMDPEMIEIGTMMAVYHFEAGARKFADYAKHMIDDCGDGIRPYLKSFYNAIRDYPGINDAEMTSYEEVRSFDVANFDKNGTDVIALANQIVNEQEVEKKVEKVKKTFKTGKKKKQDSSIGDLFGSQEASEQTDNTVSETQKEENNGQEVQLQTGSSSSEREGRHQPGQNEPVGKSEQHEVEGSDGRRMGGRDSVHPVSDTRRSGSVSGPHKSKSSVEAKPKNTRNNVSERGHDYAPKSDKARVDANIKALEIMNRLIESGHPATQEDMEALRQFSGWGGLGGAFKERIGDRWSAENPINKKLRELLTPEQYEWTSGSASASQYFTPAFTIDAMWDIARAMGFKGGNVLEGSAGIGNILGLMPRDLSEKSNLMAVEKDEAVGQMLSLLYPDAKVEIKGFEEAKIENGSVDLAITNVPFVTGLKVFDTSGDTDLSKKFRDIHNFCIAKNIRKLREGGIGIFISSSGTMDKSPKLMNWITSEGNSDVVGAFRLHSNTFGGTNATSDIIVVRKRVNGKKSSNAIDVSKSGVLRVVPYVPSGSRSNTKPKDMALDMNQYYIEHPENLGGEMAFAFEKGETYQETSKRLYPSAEVDQEKRLASWVESFKGMNWESSSQPEGTKQDTSVIYEDLGGDVKEGSMLLDTNGELCLAQRGKAVPIGVNMNKVKGKTKAECFKDYKAIKDALSAVLEYQTTHESDKGLAPLLEELNRAYDDFVNTYGHLNKNVSISFLKADMDFPSIAALENVSVKGRKDGNRDVFYSKTDVFKKRVVDKESEPKPQNVKDGIIASIYLHGRVDVPYIAEQLGKTKEEVRSEIVKSGLGFENPTTTDIDVSYEYLSGNVREKLKIAKEANTDGRYDANVKALEAVIPMNIPAHLIQFSLGSSWVDPKLYTDYVLEKTEVKVGLTNAGGTWVMSKPHYVDYEKNKAMGVRSEICNKIVLGHELIEAAMQNRTISITRTIKHYNGETETIVDKDATMACSNKIDEIRQDFKEWARKKMQSDPELSQEIEHIYNDQFNNYVPKEIHDEFIPEHFGGAATTVNGIPFNLRKHQAKAAIRATTQPLMLAHEVGTGKTFTLITTAMEMRRLGTARKPMIVVQNATVGQFVGSAKSLYPNARILTLEDADRTSEGRKNFYAKIRYNDWDMIVVPQSVFERIPDSPEREARFVQDKIEEKMRVIEQLREASDNDRDPAVRRAEKELESLQDELNEIHLKLSSSKSVDTKDTKEKKREAKAKQNAAVKAQEMLDRETDDTMDFDDMGIDALLIDEAHEYKHLGFETAMQRGVKGVDPSYSKKSQGVYLKTQAVLENNNGRNVVFATGTPISNTAAEIWTFMRYLMPADVMKSYDIFYFDDFVRNFGQIEQIPEFGASGKYKEVNRFNGYTNLPELERIWLGVADTVLTKQAGGVSDKIPAMEGDKAQDVYLPQTKSLRSVMKYVKERLNAFENMTGKEKRENSHIPLVMYGIAKAAAVDTRLVLNDAPDEADSKTNETVRQTLKSLKETKSYNGTVAIFADNYQNKKSGFNLYEDIRSKLIKKGVPEKQIIIMRSGMSVKKKLEIFDQVNRGEVRVIMGSTFTLGTGVNIQERLHTLIHVDAPVRPMDYTQRNGRILRQGNLHKEWNIPVRVLRFGVEDSLDVTAYQRLKTKGAIADSIMNGQKLIEDSMNNRVLEEEQDIFGDITAQLSGSEYALLKNQAEKQLKKLESRYSQWEQDQMYIHNEKPRLKGLMNEARRRKEEAESALGKVETIKDKTIHIGKQQFVNVDAMADFIKDYNIKQREAQEKVRTSSGDKVVSKLPIVIGGYEFVIDSETSREIKHTSSGMVTSASTKMRYSCKELGLDGLAVDGQKIKNAINDILDDIISGNDFREIIDASDAAIKRHENSLKQLVAREGKQFEEAEALEQAKAKVEEYEELMKKELEEKEAKYAEIDKDIETASGVEGVDEEEDSDEGLRFREDDLEEVNERFNEDLDGLTEENAQNVILDLGRPGDILLGAGLSDRKIRLYGNKVMKKIRKHGFDISSIRNLPIAINNPIAVFNNYGNDSNRAILTELKTEQGNVLATIEWGKGTDAELNIVTSVFGKGKENVVGWFNKGYATYINKEKALRYLRIPAPIAGAQDNQELSSATKVVKEFVNSNTHDAEMVRVRMKERAKGLAELLNLDNVEILEDTEGLKGRKARAKGWFDPNTGKIVVVVPNHKSTYDIQQTVLHEAVAHYGLRKLFGKYFNDFLDNVYNNASAEIRGRIAQRAVEKKWDIREATEEYLADLAEHTNFEKAQSEGWFQQIKNFFIRMLAKAGIRLDAELTDNELRYILWRSFDNLTNPGGRRSIIDEAKDIATQYELGVGNYEGSESSRNRVAEPLFRDGDDGSIRAYEESLKGVKYKFQEAYQDSMLPLKHLQEVIAKTSGKPIQAFEDAYMAENHLSGKNTDEARRYYEAYFKPLEKEIAKITKGDTKAYEELSDYLILKHGVERNIEYSMRAFFRGLEGEMKEEEIEQYYSDYQSAKNALRGSVEVGTISEADYLQELEAIALEYVDTIDDYSGTRALLGRMAEGKMPDGVAEKDKTAHYLDKFNSVYGKEANMQELAREAIAKYENTHDVSSLWEKVNKATKYGLRKAYDSGMMSRDSYHHVDGMFRYYVPLRGWDEKTADDVYEYLGSEISPVNSVLKTAKGRKSIPDNPLPVIGNMAESAIIQGNRNMMKQSFLNMVQNHPTDVTTLKKAWYVLDEVTGEWYVSYPDIEAQDTADDIADKVHDHELRMEELESKGLATQKRGKLNINYRINKGQAKEHVVNVKRNGQDYVIYVNGNPRAAQALNGMTNPDAVTSKPLQAWNAANRWLAANFTTRNPAFVLSNISRDLIFAQSAVMVKESPEYAGKFFVNAGKAMSVVMRNINGKGSESNEMDRYFREFVENGGETGYMHLTDVDQYKKKIKRDLERLSGKEVKAKAAARYCIDRLEDFNRWAEDVSRFAAYATSRQMGRSIQESVRDAKEVTVNFNKKGAGFKTGGLIGAAAGMMHGTYLFFKVGIQSLVNFGRLAMKNPGKMGAMLGSFAATGVLVPAVINPMLYALLGGAGDDDPYKNMSEWERRNNLCIYCGGGGFIKIPLPIELRAFYGLGEMSYDYMTRKTRVRPEEVAFALANQITELLPLNPLGNNGDIVATLLPDVLQPFYEVSQNKDYAGRPVYKETPFNELDPEFKRTYKGTSGWLVDVSQYMNEATGGNDFKKGKVDFNPAKIEHIYEYYFGGMGKTINQLGKTLWYGAKSIANGEKDENLVLRNTPIANRFLSFPDEKNANAGINKEYFRMVDEWETMDHELTELAKKGALMNPKYLQQYIDLTNSDQYKWYKAFESFKKSLDGLYQMRKAIPDEEMQKQVDEQMMVLKRQAIDEMEKFSK